MQEKEKELENVREKLKSTEEEYEVSSLLDLRPALLTGTELNNSSARMQTYTLVIMGNKHGRYSG